MTKAQKQAERKHGFNVNFDPSVWETLRVRAFREQTTISEQVRRAVTAYLNYKRGK